MAEVVLDDVQNSTRFIVGGKDVQALGLNREALAQVETEKRWQVISGARHLFEEAGALDEGTLMARERFQRHLTRLGRGAASP